METEVSTGTRTEITAANEKFMNAFTYQNAETLANLYTEDGMLLPAGSDVIKGRSGIQKFWKGAMDMGIKQVRLQSTEVEDLGHTAIELGHYELSAADEKVLDHGKYLVIWKKENENWKLQKDIWTSNKTGA